MIASLAYQISYWYLKPFMSYRGFKRWKSDTHAHTHTSGRQLKITSLDVLDYSEYSISKKKFSRKHSFLSDEAKITKNCFYADVIHNFIVNFFLHTVFVVIFMCNLRGGAWNENFYTRCIKILVTKRTRLHNVNSLDWCISRATASKKLSTIASTQMLFLIS